MQGGQRDEQKIGERDARELHRHFEFLRVLRKARREDEHQPRHRDFGDKRDDDESEQEHGKRVFGKAPRGHRPLAFHAL